MPRLKRIDEQHVVLQMNMLHQVIAKLRQSAIQRAPGVTGIGRRRDLVGQGQQFFQAFTMLIMLEKFGEPRRAAFVAVPQVLAP